MSRDRVKVSDIERCFPGVAYERAQGFRVRFDRVASFIHHHPAAASTFETPQLVVYNSKFLQNFFDRKVSEQLRRCLVMASERV